MRIVFKFDDRDQRNIYDGLKYRQDAIDEAIEFLQTFRESLPSTITVSRKIDKCHVFVERDTNGLP